MYFHMSLYCLFIIYNAIITMLTIAAYIAKKYCVKNPNIAVIAKQIPAFLFIFNPFLNILIFIYKYAIVKNVIIMYILINITVDIPPMLNPYNITAKNASVFFP